MSKKEFKSRLRWIIKELDLSEDEFAAAGKVSKQTLYGYLNTDRQPKQETLELWTKRFKLNGHWLLTGLGEKFSPKPNQLQPDDSSATFTTVPSHLNAIGQFTDYIIRNLKAASAPPEEIRQAILNITRAQGGSYDEITTKSNHGIELVSPNEEAVAIYLAPTNIVVCSGSIISGKSHRSMSAQSRKMRERLKRLGWLINTTDQENSLVLLKNSLPMSASASAGFVAGCSINGKTFWRVKETGWPLKALD